MMEYTNSQISGIIAEYIHNERDRRMMTRRLVDRATIERLAEEFDLSVSQTKRIIQKNLQVIFGHYPPAA